MSGIYTGVGRVISVKFKLAEESGFNSNLLELAVSIGTGERKKEGEQYPPSNIFNVPVWGKYADALQPYASVGRNVYVSGLLTVPNVVVKEGEGKAYLSIKDAKVEFIGKADEEVEETAVSESVQSAKTKAKAKTEERAKKIDLEEMNFDD